jgi:hypothetical protein
LVFIDVRVVGVMVVDGVMVDRDDVGPGGVEGSRRFGKPRLWGG